MDTTFDWGSLPSLQDIPWQVGLLVFVILPWLWKNIGQELWRDYREKKQSRETSGMASAEARKVSLIKQGVAALREAVGADRAAVYRFGNGGKTLPDMKSEVKLNFWFEVLKDYNDTPSLWTKYREEIKNIPIVEVAWWIVQAESEPKGLGLRFLDTNECPDLRTRNFYKDNNIRSVMVAPIYNANKELTYLISYEWIGEPSDPANWVWPQGVPKPADIYNMTEQESNAVAAYFRGENDKLSVYV